MSGRTDRTNIVSEILISKMNSYRNDIAPPSSGWTKAGRGIGLSRTPRRAGYCAIGRGCLLKKARARGRVEEKTGDRDTGSAQACFR